MLAPQSQHMPVLSHFLDNQDIKVRMWGRQHLEAPAELVLAKNKLMTHL